VIDSSLLKSFFPPRTQVLQVQLLPFSLGHLLTLSQINSPFLTGEAFRVLDLFAAVRVCSLTWEECQQFVASTEDYATQFEAWLKKVGSVDFQKKAELFADYLSNGQMVPEFRFTEKEDQASVQLWTPIEQRMRIRLMRELGLSESEVMNRPLTLCWWDYMTLKECRGECAILTEDAIAAEDAAWEESERLCQSLK